MPTIEKIALIGGSGFIGSYIAARLCDDGKSVSVATRRRERSKDRFILLPQTDLIECNVHDDAALATFLAGHDAVVNMVGILHGSRATFERVHVGLTQKVIQACQRVGVKRLVHISALGAAADAPSDYQQTKARAEELVRASGLDWTILRPSVVFGRGDSFLTMFAGLLRIAPFLPMAGADTRFQPVWVEDVARAAAACLDREATIGQTFELAGPRTYTLRQLVDYVGRLTGHRRPVIGLSHGLAMLQAALFECLPNSPLSRDNVRSLGRDNVSATGFPVAALGFAPTALETVAPLYLAGHGARAAYDDYRSGAHR